MIFSSASFLSASPLRSDLGWFGSSMRCAKTLTTVTRLPDTGVRPDCANAARDRETERQKDRETERRRDGGMKRRFVSPSLRLSVSPSLRLFISAASPNYHTSRRRIRRRSPRRSLRRSLSFRRPLSFRLYQVSPIFQPCRVWRNRSRTSRSLSVESWSAKRFFPVCPCIQGNESGACRSSSASLPDGPRISDKCIRKSAYLFSLPPVSQNQRRSLPLAALIHVKIYHNFAGANNAAQINLG